jgi:hypothetical protein
MAASSKMRFALLIHANGTDDDFDEFGIGNVWYSQKDSSAEFKNRLGVFQRLGLAFPPSIS